MNDINPKSHGLTTEDARRRLANHGFNQVAARDEDGLLEELIESLREPLVLLLLSIGGLYLLLGELRDALIIFGVIITVALTEATIEWRAGRAVAALSAMAEPKALVWRDNALGECSTMEIVPDDLIELSAGSRIPADAQLVESSEFAVDESLVTGESRPVERDAASSGSAILQAGTAVVRGRGRALVLRTGKESTLGRIAELVAQTKEPKTPLQRRMGELARTLLWVAIAVSVLIPTIGIVAGRPPMEMLLTGLSLAFATIPEELPVLIVVVLGLGSLKLVRHGAIIRRLLAAETLGAVTVVCTDKTGTLTENRMTVASALTASALRGGEKPNDEISLRVLRAAALASEQTAFDPIDKAIRIAAKSTALGAPENYAFPFDRSARLSSGYVVNGCCEAGIKGAPEAVLAHSSTWRDGEEVQPLSDAVRHVFIAIATEMGRDGQILAVGSKELGDRPKLRGDIESDFVFEGIVVLHDPVRPEVPEAIRTLRSAGVQISIITGDQASTATAVARQVGISGDAALTGAEIAALDDAELARRVAGGTVVARAQPADKLRIVKALGVAGEIVMVTGDGVNDAPALRAAAVGVAMGRIGSDIARQSAQVVLTNDSFATLVLAVREGRRLNDNFRKAIQYYLAVKVALVLVMAIAAMAGASLPFTPVQIVILELFMDLGASLAFVSQPAEADIMTRPPRDPAGRFLDRSMLTGLLAGALTLAAIVGVAFWIGREYFDLAQARTFALIAWLVGHAMLGFAMAGGPSLGGLRGLFQNAALTVWIVCATIFAALLVALPVLHHGLGTAAIPVRDAILCALGAAIIPLWFVVLRSDRYKGVFR